MHTTKWIQFFALAAFGLNLALAPLHAAPPAEPLRYALPQLVGDPSFRHAGRVTSLTPIDGGRRVLSSSQDGSSRIWDAQTGEQLARFAAEGRGYAWCAVVTADGKLVIDCGNDDKVTVWNRADGKVVRQLEHGKDVFRLALVGDGDHVVACDGAKKAVLWNFRTGEKVREFVGHKESVYGVAVSPDGKTLATASSDQAVKLWELGTGKLLHTLGAHKDDVCTVAFSPDGAKLLSVGDDKLCLWPVEGGEPLWTLKPNAAAKIGTFSPDGARIAVGLSSAAVQLLDADKGETQRTLELPGGTAWPVAFSADGKSLWAGASYLICRLDTQADAAPASDKSVAPVTGFDHVTAGRRGAGVYLAGEKSVWRWPGRGGRLEPLVALEGDRAARGVRLAPDGKTLLVHHSDHQATLYELPTGNVRCTLVVEKTGSNQQWRWSPDSRSVLLFERDRAHWFGASNGALYLTMPPRENSDYPHAVAVDRSARRVAVASGNPVSVRYIDALTVRDQGRVAIGLNDVDHLALLNHGGVLLAVDGRSVNQFGQPVEAKTVKHTPEKLAQWVAQLGHERYAVREAATRALIEAGDAAAEALKRADRSDPEVIARLARIKRGKATDNLPRKRTKNAIALSGDATALAVHPDETHWAAIVGTPSNSHVVIGKITPRGPEFVQRLAAPHGPASLAFSADGKTLYTANLNGTLSVYHAREPE